MASITSVANVTASAPTLQTERLVLRAFRAEDVEPLVEIHEHPEVLEWIGGHRTANRAEAFGMVAMMSGHWNLRGYGPWVVVEALTQQVIGRVGLWNPDAWPGVDLGWVVRRTRWGQGFATEAARAALQWAWDHVATDHIISIIVPGNARSVRVAEKIGERFERSDRHQSADVLIYGVHRPMWQAESAANDLEPAVFLPSQAPAPPAAS